MIQKFSEFLPANVEEQKEQIRAYDKQEYDPEDEYYGEDYGDQEKEEEKVKTEDRNEAEKKLQEDPDAAACS